MNNSWQLHHYGLEMHATVLDDIGNPANANGALNLGPTHIPFMHAPLVMQTEHNKVIHSKPCHVPRLISHTEMAAATDEINLPHRVLHTLDNAQAASTGHTKDKNK